VLAGSGPARFVPFTATELQAIIKDKRIGLSLLLTSSPTRQPHSQPLYIVRPLHLLRFETVDVDLYCLSQIMQTTTTVLVSAHCGESSCTCGATYVFLILLCRLDGYTHLDVLQVPVQAWRVQVLSASPPLATEHWIASLCDQ